MTQLEPAPAVHLEQAMIDNTRSDTAETRLKVYQELLFSDLMIALSDPDPKEASDSTQEAITNKINVAIFANQQGLKFAAVFTSPQAVRRWRPEGGQYATLRGQDIFKLLEPSPTEVIVINPGSAPIVALPKTEFRQLATGIVPKATRSPVQVPQNNQPAPQDNKGQMQMRFVPDVFKDDQKQRVYDVLFVHDNVAAAAIGLIQQGQKSPDMDKPHDANDASAWIPTIFLRSQNIETGEGRLKDLCFEIRNLIKKDNELFTDVSFEVGIMADPNFWESMNKNNYILFDKNYKVSPINATPH